MQSRRDLRSFLLTMVTLALTVRAAALNPFLIPVVVKFRTDFGPYWTFIPTGDRNQVASVVGRPSSAAFLPDVTADRLFESVRDFHPPLPLTFDDRRKTDEGRTSRYWWDQKVGKEKVENAYVLITFDGPSQLYNITLNTVGAQVVPGPVRNPKAAEMIARTEFDRDIQREDGFADVKHLRHLFDPDIIAGEPLIEAKTRSDLSVREDKTALLAVQGIVHRVYHVRVRALTPAGDNVLALREYAIDAVAAPSPTASLVLRKKDLMPRMSNGHGRVFDPNPENTLHDEQLIQHPPASDSKAYFNVELCDLNDPIDGKFVLSGPYVRIDQLSTNPAPPIVKVPAQGLLPTFNFDRGSPDFPAVMAYYHIDRLQRYVENLGLGNLVQRPLIAYAVAGNSSVLDAGYSQNTPTEGSVWFAKTASIFAAEDADVITHEYGHAILERTTQGRFTIADNEDHPDSEAGAISEGFCDYLAFSASFEKTANNTFKLDCFAEWGNGGPCYRTYQRKPSHKTFVQFGDRYANCEIWSGTLVNIFTQLGNDRETADWLIVQGQLNGAFTGDAPTMNAMANGILIADAQKFGGSHKETLCSIFKKHDIGTLDCCPDNACSADVTKPPPPAPSFL
jgi:hypothetical protein